jgi:pimeloyl-ACP methyl ester carboxylesterase
MKSRYINCLAQIILAAIFICSIATSCKDADSYKDDTLAKIDFNQEVVKIETLGNYSRLKAYLILKLAKVPGKVETTCGFYLYRISYKTRNFNNDEILVSGLLAIPHGKTIKGIVSYQHGTTAERGEAPSKPTTEGIGISCLFAGNEYMVLIPDYIGLGISQEIPTYMHTQSTVNTVIDFLKTGFKIINPLTMEKNPDLYLLGFSQGGSVTAAVQREMEINNTTGLTLIASACIAGAYNLKDISVKYAINNKSTMYLGYIANSYAHIYCQDLSSVIKNKYVNLIPILYDGSKSIDFIEKVLPKEPDSLYTQKMIEDIIAGNKNWFTIALGQNETYRWKPITRLRFFYGTKDVDVSPQDAISAYNDMKNLGGNVELINAGNYDHTASLIHSLPEIQRWFNNTR